VVTPEQRAITSILDVVEELAQGLAHGQTPEGDWAEIVTQVFTLHRRELRGHEVEWPTDKGGF